MGGENVEEAPRSLPERSAMMRAVTPLVLLVLLAGCLGGSETEAPAAQAPEAAAAPAADAATVTATDAAANATAPGAALPVVTTISYAGSSPTGVCEWAASGACVFMQSGAEDFHAVEAPGQAKLLSFQVTYTGTLPGMDFYVGVCAGENEATDCADYVTGPSPIAVQADLSSYPPGTVFGISIGALATPAMMAGVAVFGPADFQVEGTLTSVPVSA